MKKIFALTLALMLALSLFTVVSSANEYIDRSDWTYTASSEMDGWGFIDRAFDGKTDTFWHTKYIAEGSTITHKDPLPHTIEINIPKTTAISGMAYLPRQDHQSGHLTTYEVYISSAGTDKGELAATVNIENTAAMDEVVTKFKKSYNAKKITIVVTKSAGVIGAAAEFNFIGASTGSDTASSNESAATEAVATKLDKTEWILTASSEMNGWGFVDRMADGDTKTYWHTMYTAEGSTIKSKDDVPHTVEITFPKVESISAMEYLPRQDQQSGRWIDIELYASESGTDKGTLIKKASFDHTKSELQTIDFGKTVKAKKVTLIVTKSAGGFGTCSEIDFISKSGAAGATSETITLDKSEWVGKASSEYGNNWGSFVSAFDGKENTYWHSKYTAEGSTITSSDKPPYTLEITFPKVEEVNAMKYFPRQDGQSGRWLEIEIYASESGEDKGALVKKATFVQTDATWQTVKFGKTVNAKKMTIVVTKGAGNHGTCAEIDFLNIKEVVTEGAAEKKAENPYPEKFDTSDWIISTNSEKSWGKVEKILDGDVTSFWHTNYEEANGQVLSHDMPPYDVDITLPKLTLITGMKLTPRSDRTTGAIKKYRLYASREDEGEMFMLMEEALPSAYGAITVDFACGIEVKRIRFEVLEGSGGYATLAEFELIPGKADTLVVPYEDFNQTMNENKLHKIDPTTIKAENDLPTWANTNVSTIVSGQTWQTEEIQGGEPVIIRVDLGEVKNFSAMSVRPRQSKDYHGYWLKFNVWASSDGVDYLPVLEDYSFPKRSLDEKLVYFDESVTARYVEIEVTEYSNYRVSCEGLYFWQTYEDKTKSSDSGKFTMKIGSNEIKVEKGKESYTKTIDVAPYITSAGSTLIPLRGLLEEMGAEIAWNGDTQTITLTKGLLEIKLQIQNKLVYVEDPVYGHTMYTLTSAPRIKDSRTFIPVRFVSEMLGYNVDWDGTTQTITITK